MEYFHRVHALVRDFQWETSQLAITYVWFPLTTCAVYFVVIWWLKNYMREREPMPMTSVLVLHNYFLSLLSGALFVVLVHRVWVTGQSVKDKEDKFFLCNSLLFYGDYFQGLYFINYLCKYYELVDTVFLVLRKRPTPFIHVYHHPATLMLTYVQLQYHTAVQWVPISANLFVHWVMYYYFAQLALRRLVWWKRYVTLIQIIQFTLDVIACTAATYIGIADIGIKYTDYPLRLEEVGWESPAHFHARFPPGATRTYHYCEGTLMGAWWGIGILSSYLVLFLRLYSQLYIKKGTSMLGKKSKSS